MVCVPLLLCYNKRGVYHLFSKNMLAYCIFEWILWGQMMDSNKPVSLGLESFIIINTYFM